MKTTKLKVTVMVLLLACAVSAEDDITVSVNNTVASAFVAGTGINWVNGPVLMTDVGTTITRGDHAFSGIYWQVLNLDDSIGYDNPANAETDVTERDFIFDYTYSGNENADVSLGYIYYDFVQIARTGGNGNTEDVYARVTLKNLLLSPSATVLYDIDSANEGVWGNFAVSHSLDVTEDNAIDLWAKAVWSGGNYGAYYFSHDGKSDSGFQSYGVGASTSMPLCDAVSASIGVAYWTLADNDGVLGKTHADWENNFGTESERDTVVASASLNIMLK